ncbi:ABC transporter substrate-binding protein [Pseudonocardia sp. ICBG1034]|uniref:ABC transporter substrate-binding protein n=1 Tax=Pseudonocardia sp. ICBG1034 TaxID=2844381 RepID=UPI001CD00D7C|nr:ABC transporter substrate-binding protein [Pseudonocardia sp. ICBG1034]
MTSTQRRWTRRAVRGTLAGAVALLTAVTAACGSQAGGSGDQPTVRYVNNSAQPLVGLVAEQEGFFTRSQVQVDFTEIQTGTEAIAGMLGGSSDFVTAADARFVQAVSKQLPVVAVAVHNTGFLASLLVPAGDTATMSMEDLRSKRIGIQLGSGVHTAWLRHLDAIGMKESDFQVVNLAVTDMPAALAGGSLDGALVWQPYVNRSVEAGLTRVAMTPDRIAGPAGVIYPFYVLTTRSMVDERPDDVQRFVSALVCAEGWITQNPDASVGLLEPEYRGLSRDTVQAIFAEQTYGAHVAVDDEVLADTTAQARKLTELGSIPMVPDLAANVDTQFTDAAAAQGCAA